MGLTHCRNRLSVNGTFWVMEGPPVNDVLLVIDSLTRQNCSLHGKSAPMKVGIIFFFQVTISHLLNSRKQLKLT
jgi:hypothetical protein